MTKQDFEKFYSLLRALYPNRKQLDSKQAQTAWWYVVEPYGYDACKSALLLHARASKHFPDPADVTADLPPENTAKKTNERVTEAVDEAGYIGNVEGYARVTGVRCPVFASAQEADRWWRQQQI